MFSTVTKLGQLYIPRPDVDEDAHPISVFVGDRCYVGVFDGLGGRGSATHDGKLGPRTQAWYASRVARAAVSDFLLAANAFTVGDLESAIARRFFEEFETVKSATSSRLSGTLVSDESQAFPTTMALAEIDLAGQEIVTYWAGDSRCYLIDHVGMRPLTKDESSAMTLQDAYSAPPLSNFISRGRVKVRSHRSRFPFSPFCVFACSDGLHEQLSPIDFAVFLLRRLNEATTQEEFIESVGKIADEQGGQLSDDLTAAFFFHGEYGQLKRDVERYLPRLKAAQQGTILGQTLSELSRAVQNAHAEVEASSACLRQLDDRISEVRNREALLQRQMADFRMKESDAIEKADNLDRMINNARTAIDKQIKSYRLKSGNPVGRALYDAKREIRSLSADYPPRDRSTKGKHTHDSSLVSAAVESISLVKARLHHLFISIEGTLTMLCSTLTSKQLELDELIERRKDEECAVNAARANCKSCESDLEKINCELNDLCCRKADKDREKSQSEAKLQCSRMKRSQMQEQLQKSQQRAWDEVKQILAGELW